MLFNLVNHLYLNLSFMRIVHVAEPFAGGIVAFLRSLTDHLSGDLHLIIHGERATVMPMAEAKNQLRKANVRFIHWRSAQRSIHLRKDLSAFVELYTILKRLKSKQLVDVVHLHSSKSGFLGRMACRMLNIKNVIYTPNGAPFMAGESFFSNFIYKQLERIGSMFGGQVVCCSPSEQEMYQKAGIQAVTINNGITIRKSNLPSVSLAGNNKLRIVTSGRILHQKDPALFNAIAAYFEELPQFEFIWAGDGPDAHFLTAPNITITGWLSQADVSALMRSSDIYLSTARFEGLSFAVLEALSMKKPVLLTDCVGNRDMIRSGLNGDLFTSAEQAIVKIVQYSNNKNMLAVMGEHSAEYCETAFNLADTRQQYRNLYRGVNEFVSN